MSTDGNIGWLKIEREKLLMYMQELT